MAIKFKLIFYSMYGHVHKMAQAVVEGAKQVPAPKSRSIRCRNLFRTTGWRNTAPKPRRWPRQSARGYCGPVGRSECDYFSERPRRFGNMAAQMRNFLDQTGGLWMKGALIGKVGSVFCFHWHPARRPRNHDYEFSHHAAATTAWSSSVCPTANQA